MSSNKERGFSIIELTTVVTILVVLVAIAVPQFLSAVYAWRINGAASELAGLIQQARILAEKQNTTIPVYTGSLGTNTQGAFIGTLGTTWVAGEPEAPYGGNVTNGAAANVPATLSPGFTPESSGTTLYFSGRGLPVKASGSTYVPSNGVVFYLTDSHSDWAAVSVTGSGRTKVWRWTGQSWH